MDQETAFSPDVYCVLLDGTQIRFGRAKMKTWAKMAAVMKADRVKVAVDDLNADKTLKPAERAELRGVVLASIVTIQAAIDACTLDPEWISRFLVTSATEAGETEDRANAALDLIPSFQQAQLADQLAMLPVVANEQRGTKENPHRPGVDRSASQSNDPSVSTGDSSAVSPGESSESIPLNAPTDTSSS